MSKDYSKCPDCDGIDIMGSGLFGSRGDGRCSHCHGEGRVPDAIRGLAAPFVGCDPAEVCEVCSGSGQCQTCGGTGYVWSEEESSKGGDDRQDNYSSGYDPYYESSSSRSYGSGGGGSSSPDDTGLGCLGIFVFIFLIALIAGMWEHRSSPGVTYVSQPAQPAGPGNQAYAAPDTAKIVARDTVNHDSAGFADPDTNMVKADLLGKKMPHWSFDNLSEFLELKVVRRETLRGRLFLSADLRLQSLQGGKRYHAMTLLGYEKGSDAWQFSTIDETLFNEESTGDPAVIPSVSRQYADLVEAGYETAGDIVFSTSCPDCNFQYLISGQKQEVAYLKDDPGSGSAGPAPGGLKLQQGLYEFSIINTAGQKKTFKAYIKPGARLFIRITVSPPAY